MNLHPDTSRYDQLVYAIYTDYAEISYPLLRINALGHTSMVDSFMTLICLKRGIDLELGKIAALLHDVGKYCLNSSSKAHEKTGSDLARKILTKSEAFTEEETEAIAHAILHHSEKSSVHEPLCEALKDADTLASWAAAPMLELSEERQKRLERTLAELSIGSDSMEAE